MTERSTARSGLNGACSILSLFAGYLQVVMPCWTSSKLIALHEYCTAGGRSWLQSGRHLKAFRLLHGQLCCRIVLVQMASHALIMKRICCQQYQFDSTAQLAMRQSNGLRISSGMQPRTTAFRAVFVESGSPPAWSDLVQQTGLTRLTSSLHT